MLFDCIFSCSPTVVNLLFGGVGGGDGGGGGGGDKNLNLGGVVGRCTIGSCSCSCSGRDDFEVVGEDNGEHCAC